MVRHATARQKFSSYKTEALQVEPRSKSNFLVRRGTIYKTGLRFTYYVSYDPYDSIKGILNTHLTEPAGSISKGRTRTKDISKQRLALYSDDKTSSKGV